MLVVCTGSAACCLLSEQPPHTLQHAVLVRVVWVVFRRNLEQRRESGGIGVHTVAYTFGNLQNQLLFD